MSNANNICIPQYSKVLNNYVSNTKIQMKVQPVNFKPISKEYKWCTAGITGTLIVKKQFISAGN